MFNNFCDLIQYITGFLPFDKGSNCSLTYTYTNETTFEITVKINKHLGKFYSKLVGGSCKHKIILSNDTIEAKKLLDLAETFNVIAYNIEQYLKELDNVEQYLKDLEPHYEEPDIFINFVDDWCEPVEPKD